jgi:hypothetical protein
LSDDEKSPEKSADEKENEVIDFISFRERKFGNQRRS